MANKVMVKKVNNTSLEEKIRRYKELSAQSKVLDSEIKELKENVKTFMNNINENGIVCGNYTAKMVDYSRDNVDSKTLKENNPTEYYEVTTTTSYQRLTIK